jgi:hypothetical protein
MESMMESQQFGILVTRQADERHDAVSGRYDGQRMQCELVWRLECLTEAEFSGITGSEERCRGLLERQRWPEGFVCPTCGSREGTRLSTRPLIQCRRCRHQISLTSATIFHATKLPLTTWFRALRLVATSRSKISAAELGRRLGVGKSNAWLIRRKIAKAIAEQGSDRLPVVARGSSTSPAQAWEAAADAGRAPLDMATRVRPAPKLWQGRCG